MKKLFRKLDYRFTFYGLLIFGSILLFIPVSGNGAGIPYADKVFHFLLFFTLGISGSRAYSPSYFKQKNVYAVLAAYAVLTEYVQGFIPGRERDATDILFNFLGMLGSVLYKKIVD